MLKELFELQLVEVAERSLHDEKKECKEYKQLKELKASFSLEKEKYLKIEKEVASLTSQISLFPQQVQGLEEKIATENKSIYDGSVVNVKELAAREAQAAALADRLKELQSLNALYQGELEQRTEQRDKSKGKITEDYQLFMKIKDQYQKVQEANLKKIATLAKQKKVKLAGIPKADLIWYESVKGKCDGTPVAKLNADRVCSGCHTIVPPITFKRTCHGQKTYCEKCGRTLFVEETEIEGSI